MIPANETETPPELFPECGLCHREVLDPADLNNGLCKKCSGVFATLSNLMIAEQSRVIDLEREKEKANPPEIMRPPSFWALYRNPYFWQSQFNTFLRMAAFFATLYFIIRWATE